MGYLISQIVFCLVLAALLGLLLGWLIWGRYQRWFGDLQRSTKRENDDLSTSLALRTGELEKLRTQYGKMTGDLELKTKTLADIEPKFVAAQSDLEANRLGREDLRLELVNKTKSLLGFTQQFAGRDSELADWHGRFNDSETRFQNLQKDFDARVASLKTAEDRTTKLDLELSSLRTRVGEAERLVGDKEKTIADLNTRLKRLAEDNDKELKLRVGELETMRLSLSEQGKRIADADKVSAQYKTLQGEGEARAKRVIELETQLNSLRTDLEASRTGRDDLKAELAAKTNALLSLQSDLGAGRSGRDDLQKELANKTNALLSLQGDLEASRQGRGDLEAELANKTKALLSLEADLQASRTGRDDLQAELSSKTAALLAAGGAASSLTALRGEHEQRGKRVGELEKDLQQSSTRLRDLEGNLTQLRLDIEARSKRVNELEADLAEVQTALSLRNKRVNELEHDLSETRSRAERVGELENELGNAKSSFMGEANNLRGELEGRGRRVSELESEAGNLRNELGILGNELERRRHRNSELEGQLKGMREELTKRDWRIGELEAEFSGLQGEIAKRDTRISELDGHLNTLRLDADDRTRNLGGLESEFANVRDELSSRTLRVGDLETELGALYKDFELRGGRINELEDELRKLHLDVEARDRSAAESEQTFATLQKDVHDRQWRIGELEAEIHQMRSDMDARGVRLGELEHQLGTLRGEWEVRGNRVSELESFLNDDDYARRRLASRYTVQDPALFVRYLGRRIRLRGYVTNDVKEMALSKAVAVYGGEDVIDNLYSDGVYATPEWATRFFEAAPQLREELKDGSLFMEDGAIVISGVVFSQEEYSQAETDVKRVVGDMRVVNRLRVLEKDDLKEIKGVQDVLEGVLHDLGIYTFRQIATWTPEELEQVRGSLQQFKGRIEREHWMEQSTELHEKKYGEKL